MYALPEWRHSKRKKSILWTGAMLTLKSAVRCRLYYQYVASCVFLKYTLRQNLAPRSGICSSCSISPVWLKLNEKITRLIPLNLRNILNCSTKSVQLSDRSTFLIDFGEPNSASFNKLKTVEMHTVKSKWGQFQISLKINNFLNSAPIS